MRLAVALLVLLASSAFAQNTFCQRYAAALFQTSTAATQKSLLTAVVVAAAAGRMGPTVAYNNTGLFNAPLNKPYFDGTKPPMINFITDTAQQTTLVDHLVRFFASPLGCVEFAATAEGTWTAKDLKEVHKAMTINQATYTEFVLQVAGGAASYGVPLKLGATDDMAFPAAVLGQFGKGAAGEICNQADCAMWTDFVHFMVDADTFWVKGSNPRVSEGKLIKGGYVHFDLEATDNIVEAESAAGTTAKAGGLTSGAVSASVRSYTVQLNTEGTHWFYSDKAPATKRATVVVALSSAYASAPASLLAVALAALFAFVAQRV